MEKLETPRINFIGMSNTIEVEGRPGEMEIYINANNLEMTDEELLQIRDLQKETAEKLKAILDK